MKNINEDLLRYEGFKEYNPQFVDYADKCFEKEYSMEYGTYFLSIKRYGEMYRNGILVSPERYEAFARLFKYGTHEPVEITFDFDTLDEVNDFILEMFKNKMIESCR